LPVQVGHLSKPFQRDSAAQIDRETAPFDSRRVLCCICWAKAMAPRPRQRVDLSKLNQEAIVAKEKVDLNWFELDIASLPAALQKECDLAFAADAKAKEHKEKVRKAVEKHWIDSKRITDTETVLLALDRFGQKKMSVAKKARESKASSKPKIGW